MQFAKALSLVVLFFGSLSNALAQTPTITGVNAFWWLGSGILSDGGMCSGHSGPCYYAQASWTANPNGASGTPMWTVQNAVGGGSVTLNCSTCTTVEATSGSPSAGCVYDITVKVSYNGHVSAPFKVAIIQPTTTTLQAGSPSDTPSGAGYVSFTSWKVTDSCGYSGGGYDVNESFGSFKEDVTNNWPLPSIGNAYIPGSVIGDVIGATGSTLEPSAQVPQSPLGSSTVMHDIPWQLHVFSQTSGQGVFVRADTQQWYRDHGRHQ